LTPKKTDVTAREVKLLLKHFRKLRNLAGKKLPNKNDSLWERAKKEASEELSRKLKSRAGQFTIPPTGFRPKRSNPSKQKQLRRKIDNAIEGKAEKRYRVLDPKYSSKLEARERKAQKLAEEIDYMITPLRMDFAGLSETNGTLLVADWKELRSLFSIKEIMRFNEQGFFDRTIRALEIISKRLKQKQREKVFNKLCNRFLQIYEITIRAAIKAVAIKLGIK